MNSIVETARQAHEEIDLYEQALAAIFLQPDKTVRRSPLASAHKELRRPPRRASSSTSAPSAGRQLVYDPCSLRELSAAG
jgi:hypothetical protein